jgi:uncharacterized protein (DUF58 family)
MPRSSSSAPAVQSLLDPVAIARGETLGFLARSIVEGYRAGDHRSVVRGFAVEFAHHRDYVIGDDMRHIDWKRHGRTDRYYIKQYDQDTNLVVHLLLDGSESMAYGSGPLTKLHYAKSLAACLAYLVLNQRDAASINIFDTELRHHLPRTDHPGKIHFIMEQLAGFAATRPTRIGAAIERLSALARSRGIVVILSDLFDDEHAFKRGLARLRAQGHEVVVFQVLDPAERTLPFDGRIRFLGLEAGAIIEASPAEIRRHYVAEMDAFCRRLRAMCLATGSHYVAADTGRPLADTFGEYLAFRQQLRSR